MILQWFRLLWAVLAALESTLALLPWFAPLRPDERVRIGERFTLVTLESGGRCELAVEQPQLVLVIAGAATLERDGQRLRLYVGDTVGDTEVATGQGVAGRIVADRGRVDLALLDAAAFDRLLETYPAIAPPWLDHLGRELKYRNDLLREVSLAYAEKLPPAHLASLLARRRHRLAHHRRSSVGSAAARLGRALFTAPGLRPSFWVLVGAMAALATARTVVAIIIRDGLQKQLFALIASGVGHPIHVHHFHYGLALVTLSGLLTLVPRSRGAIRRLAFVFGFGLGLVVDEFALLWNLNPDYYQPASRFAAAALLILIAQIVYFPALWVAIGRRLLDRLGVQS